QVFGDVRLGVGEAARWLGGEPGAAGPTELLARRDGGATARAGRLEPGATVLTEARARVVLSRAPGTLHAGASKQPAVKIGTLGREYLPGSRVVKDTAAVCGESASLLRRSGLEWVGSGSTAP